MPTKKIKQTAAPKTRPSLVGGGTSLAARLRAALKKKG